MAHIKIQAIYEQDCFFVVEAAAYDALGMLLYMEHYRWCGGEGLIQKRFKDDEGRFILSNTEVAPLRDSEDNESAYLPHGEAWKYRPGPYMDESSIWATLLSDYNKRGHGENGGYNGRSNILTRQVLSEATALQWLLGYPILFTRFKDMVGTVHNV